MCINHHRDFIIGITFISRTCWPSRSPWSTWPGRPPPVWRRWGRQRGRTPCYGRAWPSARPWPSWCGSCGGHGPSRRPSGWGSQGETQSIGKLLRYLPYFMPTINSIHGIHHLVSILSLTYLCNECRLNYTPRTIHYTYIGIYKKLTSPRFISWKKVKARAVQLNFYGYQYTCLRSYPVLAFCSEESVSRIVFYLDSCPFKINYT